MALFGPPERILREVLRLQPHFHHAQRQILKTVSTSSSENTSYKVAACVELGKPLVIQNRSRAAEVPAGHVRIKIRAASVNFADILASRGQYQEKKQVPYVPGSEIAGDVLQVGAEVTQFKPGDRVFGMTGFGDGAYAEEADIGEMFLRVIPAGVDYGAAATVIVSYATAYLALTRKAKVQPGETVLVTAAAGATGLAFVDLAKNVFNCNVIAACSSQEKCQVCLEVGASHGIDYSKEDIREKMKEITKGEGANVIIDMVGGKIWDQCVKSVGFEGRMLVIGFASGVIPAMKTNQLLLKSVDVSGVYWGNYGMRGNPLFYESIADVAKLLAEGKIHPRATDKFSLEEVNQAFDHIMNRKNKGKVVLVP